MKGSIIRVHATKGFGFILDEDGHSRFFHISGFLGDQTLFEQLQEGEPVQFTPIIHENGLRASEVEVLRVRK